MIEKKGNSFYSMNGSGFCLALLAALIALTMPYLKTEAGRPFIRLTVLFDNVPHNSRMKTAWGFSCIVEGLDRTILFDTGSDGKTLLSNMKRMKIDPAAIDMVFLSHIHRDHTGGLTDLIERNPMIMVYLPASFPGSFQKSIQAMGPTVQVVEKPVQLFKNVYSTGEMGDDIKEQGLVIDTPKGLLILTGCAHPGVDQIAKSTKIRFRKEIYLLMGGFHLAKQPAEKILKVAQSLKDLGVKKIAPSHCSGDAARYCFRKLWGENFIGSGVGAVIELYP
jgi:7,8-dihydropterin-6-yl-methyl-4-(beta-D-ribofuranosyl)aminobenzene 5'-phosphate synthase